MVYIELEYEDYDEISKKVISFKEITKKELFSNKQELKQIKCIFHNHDFRNPNSRKENIETYFPVSLSLDKKYGIFYKYQYYYIKVLFDKSDLFFYDENSLDI